MNIAIIDDECFFRSKIKQTLLITYHEYEIDCFASAKDLKQSTKDYDLVLLDIEMNDMDGLTFAKTHRYTYPNIIFVTSHKEYMVDAFDNNIVGFLTKDCIETKLLDKVKEIEARIQNVSKHTFDTTEGGITITNMEIVYFYIENSMVFLYTTKRVYRLYTTTLKQLERQFDKTFFRVAKDYIINIKHVHFIHNRDRMIQMSNGTTIQGSVRKWNAFKDAYNRLGEF